MTTRKKIRARNARPSAGAMPHALLVAGVMSGTSMDGVDVALCRIAPARAPGCSPQIKFLAHTGFPYPRAVRTELLRIMEGDPATAADLSRLNWRLGALYADCVEKAAAKFKLRPQLIGLHGQTIHHEATPTPYLGASVRSTWQIGEAAVLAERLHCPVVSDLRPADLAAGGQGAPLVPMLDYTLFRHAKRNRILLNLGGIANLTVIPAGAALDSKHSSLLAFDTGPGNMVIDALMQSEFGKPFDRNGATAAQGEVLGDLFNALWRDPYFATPPPKSCGREQFGAAFTQRLKSLAPNAAPADLIATATYLTSTSILEAISAFCLPRLAPRAPTDLIAAGGGTKNDTLMSLLAEGLADLDALDISLAPTDSFGIPSQAKESVAFALLAWLTYFGLPGNVPAATGASHPAILGKVSRP
jgi:anhydro-N-acetylmuramic acid kinase